MNIPDQEQQVRVDLAACYRLVALYGMTDQIYTHISARVPGTDDQFLINPYGQLFHEITASSLVKVDINGRVIGETTHDVNAAGFTIHSAVHSARHDATCVIHTHTTAGMAVSTLKDGLMPITQHALLFYGDIGYHDYEGIALDLEERERIIADLGQSSALILRNHGLLTVGRTVAEAFNRVYHLERACQAQIAALSCGVAITVPSEAVRERTALQSKGNGQPIGSKGWPALLRLLDNQDGSYKN